MGKGFPENDVHHLPCQSFTRSRPPDMDDKRYLPLHSRADMLFKAISNRRVRTVAALLSSGVPPNVRNGEQRTPLMHTVSVPKEDLRAHIVRLLLNHGGDVNARDSDGRTVLMHAARDVGKEDVIRLVIRTGKCDPNIVDNYGENMLTHAATCGNAAAMRILVNSSYTKHLIHVDMKNASGFSPLDIALKFQFAECVRILVKEGNADTSRLRDKTCLRRILEPDLFISRVPILSVSKPERDATGACALPVLDLPSCSSPRPSVHSAALSMENISMHSKSSTSSDERGDTASGRHRSRLGKGGTPKSSKFRKNRVGITDYSLMPPSRLDCQSSASSTTSSESADPWFSPTGTKSITQSFKQKKSITDKLQEDERKLLNSLVSSPSVDKSGCLRRKSTTDFKRMSGAVSEARKSASRGRSFSDNPSPVERLQGLRLNPIQTKLPSIKKDVHLTSGKVSLPSILIQEQIKAAPSAEERMTSQLTF